MTDEQPNVINYVVDKIQQGYGSDHISKAYMHKPASNDTNRVIITTERGFKAISECIPETVVVLSEQHAISVCTTSSENYEIFEMMGTESVCKAIEREKNNTICFGGL
ncbi:unnamed protein product [Angiostrongylus costaricensis]|uniref:DRTGG domain-containing protein n=1 Tax=Angiostrongylus costaricensis TaxID=334426 RepID=A0A0R3PVQ8_ANGCS|nr:unnamed protein product [Angiostrongylus costaricensis]